MSSADLPAPAAEGDLGKTPFAHVLLHAMQRRLSGTLVIWPEPDGGEHQGQDGVRFQDGRPVAAALLSTASSLGIGLLPFFARQRSPFAFYEADLVGDGQAVVTGRLDPLALITASLRGSAREDVIDGVVRRLDEGKLRLCAGVDLSRYGFDDREGALIDLLRAAPSSCEELGRGLGDRRLARRLVYLLAITKAVEPFTEDTPGRSTGRESPAPAEPGRPAAARSTGRPPAQSARPIRSAPPAPGPTAAAGREGGSPARPQRSMASVRPKVRHAGDEPVPEPPAGLGPEPLARWQEIAQRAAAIDEENYFQMLEVDTSASPADVQAAYLELAKRWHPDRLPREVAALRPWCARIFDHLTQAKNTIEDSEARGTYLRNVQAGGGTPASFRQVEAIVTAAIQVQKAEVFVRRRQWDQALELLADGLELNPEDADCHALRGWVTFMKHGHQSPPWDEIHTEIDRALAINDRSEKAHLYKARVLKAQKKPRMALEHFKKVVDVNPRNAEGMSEVRLATMRGSKRPKPGAAHSGLLSKLFGGNKKS